MAFRKREVRTQFGALCWRLRKGAPEILIITSRGTGRWIIPKGWPQKGQTATRAAATEAWEEAGVTGRTMAQSLGIYAYEKRRRRGRSAPCVVAVFALEVKKVAEKWPEKSQRRRKWVSPARAAEMVHEPELAQMILDFGKALEKEGKNAAI